MQSLWQSLRVTFVGGCRNDADAARLEQLRQLSVSLGIEPNVTFRPNASYSEVREVLGRSMAGLHSMRDEHFGISVVEYMAAGCIPIAHDSGALRLGRQIFGLSAALRRACLSADGLQAGRSWTLLHPPSWRATAATKAR